MSTATLDRETIFVSTIMEMADSIAFDGCHKIYVLLDKHQTEQQISYNYKHIVKADSTTPEELERIMWQWYEDSCPLRFISAIATNENGTEKWIDIREQGC